MSLLGAYMKNLFYISLFLLTACASDPEQIQTSVKAGIPLAHVFAVAETTPVVSAGDAADDPAIWINIETPSESRILGTDKQYGLMIYDLRGNQVQALAAGRVNNVDLRQSVNFEGMLLDIAVVSNRTYNSLDFFLISAKGDLQFVGRQMINLTEPYGTCMYHSPEGDLYAFVNDTDGRYQQWRIDAVMPVTISLVREFSVATQPEGCTTDDLHRVLFVGEEEKALWKFSAEANANNQSQLIHKTGEGVLVADVEGMDIYRVDEETAYLIVSNQGDYTYAVFEAQGDHNYLGSSQVVLNETRGIDGAEETDGLAVTNQNLGGDFDQGMLVFQDGFNRNPEQAQNFKMVPWKSVAEALNLKSAR